MTASTAIIHYLSGEESPATARCLLEHADILTRHGFCAPVVIGERDRARLDARPKAKACRMKGMGVCPEDILITADGGPLPDMGVKPALRATFIRNPLQVFQHSTAEDWAGGSPFDAVFCGSRETARFAETVLRVERPLVVPVSVDPGLYRPLPKKPSVACMGMESMATSFVRNSFLLQNPQHRDLEWVDLEPLTEDEAATALGEASIFLHTPEADWSRITPLEAMACGCLVVGFKTIENADYAGPGNGLWCREREVEECAQLLEPAAALTKSGHMTLDRMIRAGQEVAAAHVPRFTEDALLAAWQSLGVVR